MAILFFALRLDKSLVPNLPIRSKVGQWNWKSTPLRLRTILGLPDSMPPTLSRKAAPSSPNTMRPSQRTMKTSPDIRVCILKAISKLPDLTKHNGYFKVFRTQSKRYVIRTVPKRNVPPPPKPWAFELSIPIASVLTSGEGWEQTARASKRFAIRTLGSRIRETSHDCSRPR